MTDKTRPEPPPVQSEMEQLRDSLDSLQTMVNRIREAVGTDQPAPVRESYRIRALEVRVSDAEYERDLARERAEAASRVGTQFMSRADRAEAALDRVRAVHPQEGDYCAVCTEDFGRLSAPWPCPTIRALDGEQPAPAPAATAATRPADQPKEQRERPTHPDGTPYRYHEINAEGWEHCDGCGLWGQWTVANPHECANDRVQPADQPKEQ